MKTKNLYKEKKCKICGKVIGSIYPSQLEYNFKQHLTKHIKNKGVLKGGLKKKK